MDQAHSDKFDNNTTNDTARLEAFSDGVFGVAITLLVLNIQVPHLKDFQGQSTLINELLKQWPVYLSYVTSFFTVGIVWANHHRTFDYIVRSDHTLRMLNIFLLMTVTLNPFTTALLAEYIQQPAEQRTAATLYAAGWLLLSLAYNLLWRYAVDKQYVDPDLTPADLKSISHRNVLGVVAYLVALVMALFSALIGVGICASLTIYYLIPPRTSNVVIEEG